jgi:hypothetical protein
MPTFRVAGLQAYTTVPSPQGTFNSAMLWKKAGPKSILEVRSYLHNILETGQQMVGGQSQDYESAVS